jgi:hypothetical protein
MIRTKAYQASPQTVSLERDPCKSVLHGRHYQGQLAVAPG